MDDVHGESGFAGFSLWRHEFIESRSLDVPPRSAGLWIRTQGGDVADVAEFVLGSLPSPAT